MKKYCMYLRKSRADMDAEKHGEGETLARHEKALMELAKRQQITISKVYREIVSGETLAARPEAQALLADVEAGIWDGVLVMEVERLARGDTIDQGIVSQAFKYSGTLIITPMKTYDPSNEYDEEYFEFGLFMSRREYKAIRRRLEAGRYASAKEGKFIGSYCAYGYQKKKLPNDKGFTLEIVPEEAKIVRLVYNLYLNGIDRNGAVEPIGFNGIAKYLNDMKIPSPKGKTWQAWYIKKMLSNPTYIGKIRWGYNKSKKHIKDNSVKYVRYHDDDYIVVDGLHPAIIEESLFNAIQDKVHRNDSPRKHSDLVLQNPLAGILYCGYCGKAMKRHTSTANKHPAYKCISYGCPNISSQVHIVEERLMEALRIWLEGRTMELKSVEPQQDSKQELIESGIAAQEEIISRLENQIARAHDFLEQGLYTPEVFISRTNTLSPQLEEAKKNLSALLDQKRELAEQKSEYETLIPKVQEIIEVYHQLPDAQSKNDLLKSVVQRVEYKKFSRGGRKGASDDFELIVYPKFSKGNNNGIM